MFNLDLLSIVVISMYILIKDVIVPLMKRNKTVNSETDVTRILSDLQLTLDKIQLEVRDLFIMHNQKDNEGRYLWYIPVGFKQALEENTETMKELSRYIREWLKQQKP